MKTKLIVLSILAIISLTACNERSSGTRNNEVENSSSDISSIIVNDASSSIVDESPQNNKPIAPVEDISVDSRDATIPPIENSLNMSNNNSEENSGADIKNKDLTKEDKEDVAYTDLPEFKDMSQQMLEDMAKFTQMPQSFLDYASENGIEIKTEEFERDTEKYTAYSYLRQEDGIWRTIGVIVDMTGDKAKIVYLHNKNAKNLPSSRDVRTGAFTGGFSIRGEAVGIKFDSDNNISEMDLKSNLKLAGIYSDTMMSLFEQYP